MSSRKKRAIEISDIKNRILFAIWNLTKGDRERFVTTAEIAKEIESYFGTKVAADYVRRQINSINNDWDTFDSIKKHAEGQPLGRRVHHWRLHENAIKGLRTAFVVFNLLHTTTGDAATEDPSATTALRRIKELAKAVLGLSGADVDGRVESAIRCDYVEIKKISPPPC